MKRIIALFATIAIALVVAPSVSTAPSWHCGPGIPDPCGTVGPEQLDTSAPYMSTSGFAHRDWASVSTVSGSAGCLTHHERYNLGFRFRIVGINPSGGWDMVHTSQVGEDCGTPWGGHLSYHKLAYFIIGPYGKVMAGASKGYWCGCID